MAKVYQAQVRGGYSQAEFDLWSHSLMFAETINPIYNTGPEGGPDENCIVVTSNIEMTDIAGQVITLADDSQSETSIDISSGKFVDGNLIAVIATASEAQSDLRDFMTFYSPSGDLHLHVGVCNTTQSQDYTPDIVANSRVLKMLTPAQVLSLGL